MRLLTVVLQLLFFITSNCQTNVTYISREDALKIAAKKTLHSKNKKWSTNARIDSANSIWIVRSSRRLGKKAHAPRFGPVRRIEKTIIIHAVSGKVISKKRRRVTRYYKDKGDVDI